MCFACSAAKDNKYRAVSNKILDNLETQSYNEMGIKNDTIVDINKDGIGDTVKFDGRFNSYNVNDSLYYSLHVYGWTVLEEIDGTFYIYDVFKTNNETDKYTCGVVFEIKKDFSKKQVIEFENTHEYYVKNNDSIKAKEIESKYLIKEKLLKCELTERTLNLKKASQYGFFGEYWKYNLSPYQIIGEIKLDLDTIICMAIYTADRSPFSTHYLRLHSSDTTRFKELNKKLADWKRMSQMKAYYDNGILIIYEHGWEDTDEPYRLFVVDLNNEGVAEIKNFYKYDYNIERIPNYDQAKFTFEEEVD